MTSTPTDLAAVRALYTETDDTVNWHVDLSDAATWVPALVAELADLREQLRLAGIDQWTTEAELEYVRRDFECQVEGHSAMRTKLAKAERERDSLARRCAERFAESETLRGEIAQLRDERDRAHSEPTP